MDLEFSDSNTESQQLLGLMISKHGKIHENVPMIPPAERSRDSWAVPLRTDG